MSKTTEVEKTLGWFAGVFLLAAGGTMGIWVLQVLVEWWRAGVL